MIWYAHLGLPLWHGASMLQSAESFKVNACHVALKGSILWKMSSGVCKTHRLVMTSVAAITNVHSHCLRQNICNASMLFTECSGHQEILCAIFITSFSLGLRPQSLLAIIGLRHPWVCDLCIPHSIIRTRGGPGPRDKANPHTPGKP